MKPLKSGILFERVSGGAFAVTLAALTTLLLFSIRATLSTSTVALVYLLPVMVSTVFWGLWAGIICAVVAFLAYNYYFLPPFHTFIVHDSQDIVALVIFLVIAVLISQLVGRARTGLAAAMARESETTHLYELSLDLARAGTYEEIAAAIAGKTAETFEAQAVTVILNPGGSSPPLQHSLPPEAHPDLPPDVRAALQTVRSQLGEIQLWLGRATIEPGEERLLHTFATQAALAVERAVLMESENRARILEESDRLKSALLSSISHEFRTPLATIKAAATSLMNRAVRWKPKAREDLLAVIDEESDYLNYLVGNLLDMSRIESGALKPNRQWNLLDEILAGVLAHLHRNLSAFTLELQLPENLPLIPVDYAQMEQVFTNLLNNCAKYAPAGSIIRIEAHPTPEDELLVRVSNQGPQVSADHLSRIFDKFYRVTEPERVSGTGLGLSICKGIVEAHGGRIWAENQPDGLVFNFTLPLTLDGQRMQRIPEDEE